MNKNTKGMFMKTTDEKILKNSRRRNSLTKQSVNANVTKTALTACKSVRPSKSMVRVQSLKPNRLGLAVKTVER